MNVETKPCGYAIFDAPPALRKFLEMRATGTASKELMMQLSEAAMAEQAENRSKLPKATLIDFQRARLARMPSEIAPDEAS